MTKPWYADPLIDLALIFGVAFIAVEVAGYGFGPVISWHDIGVAILTLLSLFAD